MFGHDNSFYRLAPHVIRTTCPQVEHIPVSSVLWAFNVAFLVLFISMATVQITYCSISAHNLVVTVRCSTRCLTQPHTLQSLAVAACSRPLSNFYTLSCKRLYLLPSDTTLCPRQLHHPVHLTILHTSLSQKPDQKWLFLFYYKTCMHVKHVGVMI